MDNPYERFKEDAIGFQDSASPEGDPGKEKPQRLRLRAVETESEFFLKLLNVSAIRWLALVEACASAIIVLSQVIMYSTSHTRYYKVVDYIGIGIWGPVLFFIVAAGLAYIVTKIPSGCLIGTAMGIQITTIIFSMVLLIVSVISLVQHGYYSYSDQTYNAEVPGRVFCSFMIISDSAVLITALFISVYFCRAVCCGRQRIVESVLFDVQTVK